MVHQGLVVNRPGRAGTTLDAFEIEDLTKIKVRGSDRIQMIKAALREAVFNGKPHWKYSHFAKLAAEGINSLVQVE